MNGSVLSASQQFCSLLKTRCHHAGYRNLLMFCALFGLTLTLIPVVPAFAQSSTTTGLSIFQTRIEALEEGVKDIRGTLEEEFMKIRRQLAEGGNSLDEDKLREIGDKINRLADQIIALNTRIERTLELATDNEFKLLRMEKRIDALMRMGLENPPLAGANVNPPVAANPQPAGAGQAVSGQVSTASPDGIGTGAPATTDLSARGNASSAWVMDNATLNESLQQLPADQSVSGGGAADIASLDAENDTPQQQVAEPSGPKLLPDADPEEQYRFALSKALQNDLPAAEAAFDEFVQFNADHDRTADASFWLGRVQYMQGKYEQAAMTFSNFNADWPTDSRRVETTLWIAESISFFASQEEACGIYATLPDLLETPPEKFLVRLAKLKEKAGCG